MSSTPDLIATLATNLRPVRRLRPPVLRAVGWLALGLLVVGLLVIAQGVRPDMIARLVDVRFTTMLLGAGATAIASAIAAFQLSLPDRSGWWAALPVPSLVLWLSNIGYQCLTDWIALDPAQMTLGETARCFATLGLTGLPLSLALFLMLRHALTIRPMLVTVLGSLAVSAVTASALFLCHVLDASLLIIMWNVGTALMIVAASSLLTHIYLRRSDRLRLA